MTERIGYKSPPRATRWKKGKSGNPRGRQKGTLNLKTELAAELGEIIQIKEGGAPRRITKEELCSRQSQQKPFRATAARPRSL